MYVMSYAGVGGRKRVRVGVRVRVRARVRVEIGVNEWEEGDGRGRSRGYLIHVSASGVAAIGAVRGAIDLTHKLTPVHTILHARVAPGVRERNERESGKSYG